jgi:hypothetical protein
MKCSTRRHCRLVPSRRSRGRTLSLSLPSRNRIRRLAEARFTHSNGRVVNESLSDRVARGLRRTGGLSSAGVLLREHEWRMREGLV